MEIASEIYQADGGELTSPGDAAIYLLIQFIFYPLKNFRDHRKAYK